MALHGALETFPLTDVFGLLAATAKTGCLRVEGDGGRATVWLRDGAVVAATTDRVRTGRLDEVVCDLLRFEAGSFAFAVDDQAPEVDSAEDVHDLLSRAGRFSSNGTSSDGRCLLSTTTSPWSLFVRKGAR